MSRVKTKWRIHCKSSNTLKGNKKRSNVSTRTNSIIEIENQYITQITMNLNSYILLILIYKQKHLDAPQFKLLVAGFPPRRSGFEPGAGQVGSVMDKLALGQVFSEYFGFPCQSTFHQIVHHYNHQGQVQLANHWPMCRVDPVGLHPPLSEFNFFNTKYFVTSTWSFPVPISMQLPQSEH
jgi:hypothetical protein